MSSNRNDVITHVRIWDPGASGAVLALGPRGLVAATLVDENDRGFDNADLIDPAVPSSLLSPVAAIAHRRVASLLRDCFGSASGIFRSPHAFRSSIVRRYGNELRGRDLLDVGCGSAQDLTVWIGVAGTVTGIDLFDCVVPPDGVKYHAIPLSGEFPVQSAAFDFVVGLFVLEHVLDLRQFLAESWRALRLGGTAVWITTLCALQQTTDRHLPLLAVSHWRDFAICPQEGRPWIIPVAHLLRLSEEVGFAPMSVLTTRFEPSTQELHWRELESDADRSGQSRQLLVEVRKER